MFQNAARPRGRPRSFDESDALKKATQVFWSKGYDGVTIDDLVAGMGVGRPSLYAVFGDKRAIFLRVLRAYAERKGASAAKALLSPQSLRDSIAGFLRYAVESATEKGSARGCLLVCVARLRVQAGWPEAADVCGFSAVPDGLPAWPALPFSASLR